MTEAKKRAIRYWQKRSLKSADNLANKSIADINKQLKKYYATAINSVINGFEGTYDKLLSTVEMGQEPTPAYLYSLEKYWQMQAQLKKELQKLGDKEIALFSKRFTDLWKAEYEALAIKGDKHFTKISRETAYQMINTIWCADGKSWSQRIWKNTERLADTLNEQLINCVVTGQKTTALKKMLQDRFNVSYNNAEMLVRTEIAHIQTQAAEQRYKDYGLERYEYLGRDEHDIGCNCKKLNGKVFLLSEMQTGKNAPPLHPNCRCAIIPVIDDDFQLPYDNE